MENKWVQSGNKFFTSEISNQVDILPNNVFKIDFDEGRNLMYLSQVLDKFEFPYKIYGQEDSFIKRVVKTYKHTNKNLGILLNGIKGTGKTVTAELICNELNLPVLVVHKPYQQIPSFLNEIQQDVILFFDEYEKMYNEDKDNDASILTIMDGVLDNGFRKVFLLTTNKTYINDNLLDRPSRIRYFKTFSDLNIETIMEIVDDKLIHLQFRDDVIDFISKLEKITIDIVKTVVDEVNIHCESPIAFKDCFNVQELEEKYNVYRLVNGVKEGLLYENVDIHPNIFTKRHINREFRVNNGYGGKLRTILGENSYIVESYDFYTTNGEGEEEYELINITIEKNIPKHSAFMNPYVF